MTPSKIPFDKPSQGTHFGLYLPKHFLEEVVVANWKTFDTKENHLKPQHAINAATSAYHLHEWVFQYYHLHIPEKIYEIAEPEHPTKGLYKYQAKLIEDGLKDHFLLRDIVVRSKHLKITTKTSKYQGAIAGQGEWGTLGWGELYQKYDEGYFCLDLDEDPKKVTQRNFEILLGDYIDWWRKKFDEMYL